MQVTVRFSSWTSLSRACATELARQGLYLRRDLNAPPYAPVALVVAAPDGATFAMSAEIVTVLPGAATAVQIKADGRANLEALLAHCAASSAPDADTEPSVLLGDEADDASEEVPATSEQLSLLKQLESMSLNDKRQAALHGGKEMRGLLLRDHNKTLHPFVMKNPANTPDEVEAASRMTTINPEVLHQIAINREWTRSAAVVRNLVKNPKTPLPDALQVLERLAVSDLRAIAKGGSVRMPILQAARKKVAG